MQIDVSQYLEMLQDLPFYPYSVIGGVVLVLLLLVLVIVLARKKSSKGRKKGKNAGPIRGRAADGLSPYGELDPNFFQNQDSTNPMPPPPPPPVDPAVLAAAVQQAQNRFQEMYIEMYIGLGLMSDFERMRLEVNKRLGDGKDTYHAMSELKMSPEGVVLMQMASVSGNILQTGEQHIGKGLLGIHGQELLSVYRYALNSMQERGFATPEETQNKLNYMERKIQELG